MTQNSPESALRNCEPLIDASAAAELLQVCPKTVTRMAIRGEIPGIKVGKFWRFRASSLDEWINSKLQSDRSPCPARKEHE